MTFIQGPRDSGMPADEPGVNGATLPYTLDGDNFKLGVGDEHSKIVYTDSDHMTIVSYDPRSSDPLVNIVWTRMKL